MVLSKETVLENRYRINHRLAQGGMGAIYHGYDIKLDITVAVKENFYQTPESINQFQQEARILARLRHPNLPRVIDHFSVSGQQYLVMDFIEGHDLWEIIQLEKRPLDEPVALDYILQVSEGVAYLHRQKPPIIHRDIKPQNIKITSDGQAILVDFGIAKVGGDEAQTRTGARGVTSGFSPPEQYTNQPTTPASDIYALGATLYAILTGKKPPDSVSRVVNRATFTPPDRFNPLLSQPVCRAIIEAMRPEPEKRPQTVAVWQKMLVAAGEATFQLKTEEQATVMTPPASLWLLGPAGEQYPLQPGALVFGRAKSCDIRFQDRLVSREHATLEFDGANCIIYDEESANGTFINDRRISPQGHPLRVGDRLRIGQSEFTLSAVEPHSTGQVFPRPDSISTREAEKTTDPQPDETVRLPLWTQGIDRDGQSDGSFDHREYPAVSLTDALMTLDNLPIPTYEADPDYAMPTVGVEQQWITRFSEVEYCYFTWIGDELSQWFCTLAEAKETLKKIYAVQGKEAVVPLQVPPEEDINRPGVLVGSPRQLCLRLLYQQRQSGSSFIRLADQHNQVNLQLFNGTDYSEMNIVPYPYREEPVLAMSRLGVRLPDGYHIAEWEPDRQARFKGPPLPFLETARFVEELLIGLTHTSGPLVVSGWIE